MKSRLSLSAGARTRAVLILAAMAAGSLLLASAAEAQIGQLRTDNNYRLFQDPRPFRGKDAVGLAVNPRNARHVVEIQQDLLDGECEFNVSFDGGRTWRGGDLQAPAGFSPRPCTVGNHLANQVDGGVTFGSGQNVYLTFSAARLNAKGEEEGLSAIVARSTNGGRTFGRGVVALSAGQPVQRVPTPTGQPVRFIGGPEFALPKIAVDPGRGARGSDRVYVVAAAEQAEDPLSLLGQRRDEDTALSVSNDGGASWGPRRNVNPPTENAIEQSQPVVGRRGILYVAYRTRGIQARGVAVTPEGFVTVARSTDQGQSFQRARTAQVRGYVLEAPPGVEVKFPFNTSRTFTASTFPRLAADRRSGNVYLTYGNGPSPPPQPVPGTARAADHFIDPSLDVWFQRSTDGGALWSPPRKLNDEVPLSGEITQTRHPNLSVAPNGRLDIAWHDRRHWYRGCLHTHVECEETRLGDTYYVYSTNGGRTFSRDRRITDRSHGNDVGYDYRFGTYWDYGPFPIALGNSRVLFAWMDSREGNFNNDNQDIYLAQLNLNASRRVPVSSVTGRGTSDLSVRLSRLTYPGGPEAVLGGTFVTRPFTRLVIVNDRDTAGALAGGVLARANIGTLLASPAGGLPANVASEVRRLGPIGAYVIGDGRSLSPRVVAQLAAAGVPKDQIARISGGSPAANAALIARSMDRRGAVEKAAGLPAFDAAVIANPKSPEAGSASALAAHRRLPVLYVNGNSVPPATRNALRELGIKRTLVIGGPRVVSQAAARSLPSPKRLGGGDAYATSRAVVAESRVRGLPENIGYVADARGSPAFVGAAVARLGGLLMLSPNPEATAVRTAARLGLSGLIDRLVVVGAPTAPVPTGPQRPRCTITRGPGDDIIRGTPGNDVICAGGGDDIVRGAGGNDIVYGGAGNDTVYTDGGNDRLEGEAGRDILRSGGGNDVVRGGDGNDVAYGGGGNDRVQGDAGNDILRGDGGDDDLRGGSGDDVLHGGVGDDRLTGGAGRDELKGGSGRNQLTQ